MRPVSVRPGENHGNAEMILGLCGGRSIVYPWMPMPPRTPSNETTVEQPATSKVTSPCCKNSVLVLNYTYESVHALSKAYDFARHDRGARRGMTTDEEQDLLRAMLVMGASGLDALTKQLIRDSLPTLISKSDKAQNSFEKFIVRKLRDDGEAQKNAIAQLLARVLSRPSPQAQMIEEYIVELTGGSLQSAEALFQVAAALGLEPGKVGVNPAVLRPIFLTRNKIIHELDINLEAARRNRNIRKKAEMVGSTNELLSLSFRLLVGVDEVCKSAGMSE